ncbi:CBS domain-containing protein [Candidatus Aciduliprofundum boonei]|uniref:Signal transduction protein with CBS domains n=1 Tax=Aciduliprofundum boonei (strain DSM 19572 / T469) TaxID=439481 RepID=B5IDQ9_ACIB4|nr:CBS domain-containing protein [Candidatus Aciduliprofundum boonei]ADD08135.1 putative signal transduction protein with CBS domains [Aciduliprofundum boonei T469]EDY35526.1 hypothetical protein ABOONEI_809 [Aciduliprofundum boonei T469]EDY35667.1 hypothetical protein ABOONEI_204 [Aciduliprofundum boonei T469]HII55891.1 CBS domain-containing protein [Candidatus Aciduliprofundum boonei]
MKKVRDIRNLITPNASVVYENASLSKIAEEMIKDPKTTAVYVIDENKKLKGVIPLDELIQYIYYEYIPQDYIMYHFPLVLSNDATAQDIMLPPVYVKDTDTITDAFKKMFKNRMKEVPVVDEDMHVIGDLNMLELIMAWLSSVKNAD